MQPADGEVRKALAAPSTPEPVRRAALRRDDASETITSSFALDLSKNHIYFDISSSSAVSSMEYRPKQRIVCS